MSFQLSSENDLDKVFLIKWSDLEGRYDSIFYRPSNSLRKFKYRTKTINSLSTTLKHPPEYKRIYASKGIRLIRSQNVRSTGIELENNPVYLSSDVTEGRKNLLPQIGDVLVVRSGVNAGDVAVVDFEIFNAVIGADTLLIRCTDEILPKFMQVFFMLNCGKIAMTRYLTGATNKHISPHNLGKIKLPVPDINLQKELVAKITTAIKLKQQKESEVQRLLESIDNYLLSELGIILPERDDSLKNRIFTTSICNVSGGRFDPFYYLYCIENPKSSKYDEVALKNIAFISKGKSITSVEVVEGIYLVIAGGQTSPYSHNKYNYSSNVITISASGAYSGFAWYHTSPIFASDCSIVQSKKEQICNTEFLFNILKLKQSELYKLQQGSGQPHVYPSDIAKIGVPLPSPEKQIEINVYVRQIKEQVKSLKLEAEEILIKTKIEVEQMILGDK